MYLNGIWAIGLFKGPSSFWARIIPDIVMMIILLYSAAILIETILLVNYLKLRLVEVRLPVAIL